MQASLPTQMETLSEAYAVSFASFIPTALLGTLSTNICQIDPWRLIEGVPLVLIVASGKTFL